MARLIMIVAFCGSMFLVSCAANKPSKLAAQSQPDINGVSLYEKYCAHCHRTIAQTTKPQRNASRLRSAIKIFPSMNDLNFLSDVQLEAVASVLANVNLQQASKSQ